MYNVIKYTFVGMQTLQCMLCTPFALSITIFIYLFIDIVQKVQKKTKKRKQTIIVKQTNKKNNATVYQ